MDKSPEVVRKMLYESKGFKAYIYLLRLNEVFQYMFIWKDEIFSYHLWVKANWKNKFLNFITQGKHDLFNPEELQGIEQTALSGAMRSLDMLIERESPVVTDPTKEIPIES